MNSTEAPARIDLATKLLARLCDPACQRGEAETSALKLVAIVKRDQISLADLATALVETTQIESASAPVEPAACEILMPIGQYEGFYLRDIARTNPQYLLWAARSLTRRTDLMNACTVVAKWFGLIDKDDE